MHNMYAHNCNKVLLHLQFNVTHCECSKMQKLAATDYILEKCIQMQNN